MHKILLLTTLLLASGLSAMAAEPFVEGTDPVTGMRMEHYRAPVPAFLPGGKVLMFEEVEAAFKDPRAVFIDTSAPKGAGPDPVTGEWRLSEARENIPGSTWLANIGIGEITPDLERYFFDNLERLTAGDKSRPVVFYCLADCWMGWNAALRAVRAGYTDVRWYPDGTDGWSDFDGPLEPSVPVPFLPSAQQ